MKRIKCKACQWVDATTETGLCEDCQRACNKIALRKMVNGEPLPPDNTLKNSMTTFMKDSLKSANLE